MLGSKEADETEEMNLPKPIHSKLSKIKKQSFEAQNANMRVCNISTITIKDLEDEISKLEAESR